MSTAIGSGRWLRAGRRRCSPRAFWPTAIALPVVACDSAPTPNLSGSYFPAWILCGAVGIVPAVIIRQILDEVGPQPQPVIAPSVGDALHATG
jgi:hypothetical protein